MGDWAGSLTGARHGGPSVLNDAGEQEAFVDSGLTMEEHHLVVKLPGGLDSSPT